MEIKGTHQYPKIYALGSVEVADILKEPVEVTEKVYGSQIGFGVIDGELIIRSKGSLIVPQQPNGLFKNATAYIISIKDRLKPARDVMHDILNEYVVINDRNNPSIISIK